jgi:hypothetical protein
MKELENKMECKICEEAGIDKKFKPNTLGIHLNAAHPEVSLETYYRTYIDPEKDGKCKFCGEKAIFLGLTRGYRKNCASPICRKKIMSPHSKEYKIKVDGLSEDEYEEWKKEDAIVKRKNTIEGFAKAREVDPDFDKKNSRYCKEFWTVKGHSLEEADRLAYNETQKNRDKLKVILIEDPKYLSGKSWNSYQYWIKRGYSDEESRSIVSKKQSTFSKEKCIEKYGEEEGLRVWSARQAKWLKNYKKTNFSKVSQKLFKKIYERLEEFEKAQCFFATLKDGEYDESGINHEHVIRLDAASLKPDFYFASEKKLIEFDGTYWHDFKRRNIPKSLEREETRDRLLIAAGYQILRVPESEWDASQEDVVARCLEFLRT